MSLGKIAYECDVRKKPTYDTGEPRKRWDELPDYAQWSWEIGTRLVTDRDGSEWVDYPDGTQYPIPRT